MNDVPLHFVTPVWGREFTETFVDVTLPCLLAEGNIPSVRNRPECIYKIFTTNSDRAVIEASIAGQLLQRLVRTEFLDIDTNVENKHLLSSECYRRATAEAAQAGAAVVYLIPDMVLSNGAVRSIVARLDDGKRAVLAMGLRTVKESLVPQVIREFGGEGVVAIGSADLVRVALRHLHPIAKLHFYEGDSSQFHPAIFCWRVEDEGVLLHSFHLQPIVLRPQQSSSSFNGTIDDDLLAASNIDEDAVHIVTDSDELVWFEISQGDYKIDAPRRRGMFEVVTWMIAGTRAHHRAIFQRAIRVHTGKMTPERWDAVEVDAAEVVRRVIGAFDANERWKLLSGRLNRLFGWIGMTVRNSAGRARNYLDTEAVLARQFPRSLVKIPVAATIVVLFVLVRSSIRAYWRARAVLSQRYSNR